MIPRFRRQLLSTTVPPWVMAGAMLDLDFVGRRFWQSGVGTTPNIVTVSRASTRSVRSVDGTWWQVGPNEPGLSDRGLMAEEARTRQTFNSACAGASAGTPGVDPTGWNLSNELAAGISKTIVDVSVVNGLTMLHVRFHGTPSAPPIGFYPRVSNITPATTEGVVWTVSAHLALLAGSFTNVASISYRCNFIPATAGVIRNIIGLTSTLSPYEATNTAPAGTTGITSPFFDIYVTGPIDFTLGIAATQLEIGPIATSPIITTDGPSTRAMDIIGLLIAPPIVPAFSLLFVGTKNGVNNSVPVYFSNGAEANRIGIGVSAANIVTTSTKIGGVDVSTAGTAITAGARVKIAIAGQSADQVQSVNGAAVQSTASAWYAGGVINRTDIGHLLSIASTSHNGMIERIVMWPTRLPDATLRSLST